jgi:hypothetical protein
MRVAAAPYTSLAQAAAAVDDSATNGCEGFVFWEAKAASLCKIGGQNKPRGGAWKVKPVRKETFVLLRFLSAEPGSLVMILARHGQPEFPCGSGLAHEERRQLIQEFQGGKTIAVEVAHFGYDKRGRPEMPRALGWHTV